MVPFMNTKLNQRAIINPRRDLYCTSRSMILALALILAGAVPSRAADDAAAQKLLAEAKAKETHAQQLRAAAAASMQKASDDQMEASAEERDARILTAQALTAMGSDPNRERAFKIRIEARKLSQDAHNHLIFARNAEQKAAQLKHNAEELRKSAAGLKDQPSVAATLENEAKEDDAQAETELQTANSDKFSAQAQEERARNAWAQAEKLDPETAKQLAPAAAKPVVAQARQVK